MHLNKNKIILSVSVMIAVLLISGTGLFFIIKYRKAQQQKPGILFKQAVSLTKQGKIQQAKNALEEAIALAPANIDMQWHMAKIMAVLGKPGLAQNHAEEAWRLGKRDEDIFFFIIRSSGLNSEKDKVAYGRKILNEIEDEVIREEIRADLHIAVDEKDAALNIYSKIFKSHPKASIANKITHCLIAAGKIEEAMTFISRAFDTENIDEEGYILLTSMAFLKNQNIDLSNYWQTIEDRKQQSQKIIYHRAFIETIRGDYSEAFELLLKSPKSEDVQTERDKRLLAGLISHVSKNKKYMPLLLESCKGDQPEFEGERLFYQFISEQIDHPEKVLELRSKLDKSLLLIPGNKIIKIIQSRIDIFNGNALKTIEFYNSLEDPLYSVWPLLVFDHANALYRAELPEKSLQLLTMFHSKRKAYTQQTAMLQRNILYKLKRHDEAEKIQAFLEKESPDDEKLLMQAALLSYNAGFPKKAIKSLKPIIGIGFHEADKLHALCLYKSNRYDDFLKFRDGIKTDKELLLLTADIFQRQNAIKQAEEVLIKTSHEYIDQDVFRQLYTFSKEHLSEQKTQDILDKSRKFFPEQEWPAIEKARFYISSEKLNEALQCLNALDINVTRSTEFKKVFIDCLLRLNRTGEALLKAERFLTENPNDIDIKAVKGLCLFRMKKYNEALPYIETYLNDYPKNETFSNIKSQILLLVNNYNALDFTQRQYSRQSNKANTQAYIAALIKNSQYKKAENILKENSDKLSENLQKSLKASILVRTGKVEEAISTLSTGLQSPTILKQWIFLQIKSGDIHKGISRIEEIPLNIHEFMYLAEKAAERKNYNIAANLCSLALKKAPLNGNLINNHNWFLWKATGTVSGQMLQEMQKAVSIMPDDNNVLETYASMLLEKKLYSDIIKLLRQQTVLDNSDQRLIFIQAQAYYGQSMFPQALQLYKRAYENSDSDSWSLSISPEELKRKIDSLEAQNKTASIK